MMHGQQNVKNAKLVHRRHPRSTRCHI